MILYRSLDFSQTIKPIFTNYVMKIFGEWRQDINFISNIFVSIK